MNQNDLKVFMRAYHIPHQQTVRRTSRAPRLDRWTLEQHCPVAYRYVSSSGYVDLYDFSSCIKTTCIKTTSHTLSLEVSALQSQQRVCEDYPLERQVDRGDSDRNHQTLCQNVHRTEAHQALSQNDCKHKRISPQIDKCLSSWHSLYSCPARLSQTLVHQEFREQPWIRVSIILILTAHDFNLHSPICT